MIKAPIPQDEQVRLDALYKLGLLDTPPEERFDRITEEAVQILLRGDRATFHFVGMH